MEPTTENQSAASTRRGDIPSVLVAGLMGFVLPGFGQMFNGQINKALWVFMIFCVAVLFLMALASLLVPDHFLLAALGVSLAVAAGAWLYGIGDAMWQAWRAPSALRAWQTIPVYAAALLFAYLAVFKAGGGYVRAHLVEPFRIPSQSMAPGIVRGDFLFADKRVNCPGCRRVVRHGDVVLFIYPDNRSMVFIKRAIGLPGDRIEIDGANVKRNGQELTVESTDRIGYRVDVVERGANGTYEVTWSRPNDEHLEFEVPHGQVFVMGDNRNHSRDSRRIGMIPLADVIGIARQVWLSVDDDFGFRWERMGRQVE